MNKELFRDYGHDTPLFSLEGIKTYTRIVECYDGDTLSIIIPVNNKMYKFHCRLNEIDTPEIKGPSKDLAMKSRDRLLELITKKEIPQLKNAKAVKEFLSQDVYLVWVECLENDKYGRTLINIYSNEKDTKSFSEILRDENLGYEYHGGTKQTI